MQLGRVRGGGGGIGSKQWAWIVHGSGCASGDVCAFAEESGVT